MVVLSARCRIIAQCNSGDVATDVSLMISIGVKRGSGCGLWVFVCLCGMVSTFFRGSQVPVPSNTEMKMS